MTESPIKKRILTKVRRQFLHKVPDEDNEAQNQTNLLATPEELNDDTAHLIEPGYGLAEKNRTIQAGYQFLNGSYKVGSVRIEQKALARSVTLDLQSTHVDNLPWEYCAKRLESFGNLELATWAKRIKYFHEVYPQKFEEYSKFINSGDPKANLALTKGKFYSELARHEIEAKHSYLKFVIYADKNSVVPVSLSYNESFLKTIGYDSIEDFVEWIKENGIPTLFKGDSDPSLEYSKQYLGGPKKDSICEEGPLCNTFIYDKEENKHKAQIRLYFVKELRPEGFFVSIYLIRKDLDIDCQRPSQDGVELVKTDTESQDTNCNKFIRKENTRNDEENKQSSEDLRKAQVYS